MLEFSGQLTMPDRFSYHTGTDPPKSELWEESTLLCLQSKLWEDSLSLSTLIYTTDLQVTSYQLAVCLILDFIYVNAVCFKRLTGTSAWCWLIVVLNYSSVES